jgi:hypothetical protein
MLAQIGPSHQANDRARGSIAFPVAAVGVRVNPMASAWQLLVHRKMLNLKRFHRRLRGEISPMVKHWTVRAEAQAMNRDRLTHSCEPR